MSTPLCYNDKIYPKLGFIGAGNMAKAVIAGLIKTNYPQDAICVSAPSMIRREALSQTYGILHHSDNIQNARDADVIILAVKPQMMEEVCLALKNQVDFSDKLIITLAAGIEVHQYDKWLGEGIEIIRVMPNTPALIGEGISGIFAPDHTSLSAKVFVEKLMHSVGKVHILTQESQMHAFIAAAGSAPAYFFKFMQAMQAAAVALGCDPNEAKALVQQSAKGAILLAEATQEIDFSVLAQQVTSKGGTTEQALQILEKADFPTLIFDMMNAAAEKSKQMASKSL